MWRHLKLETFSTINAPLLGTGTTGNVHSVLWLTYSTNILGFSMGVCIFILKTL